MRQFMSFFKIHFFNILATLLLSDSDRRDADRKGGGDRHRETVRERETERGMTCNKTPRLNWSGDIVVIWYGS